jgi:hypothetical protein
LELNQRSRRGASLLLCIILVLHQVRWRSVVIKPQRLSGASMLRELTPPEGNKCSAAVWYSNVCHDWLVGNLQARGRGAWRLRGLSGGVR